MARKHVFVRMSCTPTACATLTLLILLTLGQDRKSVDRIESRRALSRFNMHSDKGDTGKLYAFEYEVVKYSGLAPLSRRNLAASPSEKSKVSIEASSGVTPSCCSSP